MATEPIIDQDYASSEDSDFTPDDVPGAENDQTDSESEAEDSNNTATAKTNKRKHDKSVTGDAEDEGIENSGDEAVIEKGRKKRKKSAENDEGDDGGLIKTRRQRAQEKAERKAAAASGPVTVDVNALWAQMSAAPVIPNAAHTEQQTLSTDTAPSSELAKALDADPPDTIRIKRTYNFAGRVHVEEKVVERDSAEARLYLASQGPHSAAQLDLSTQDGSGTAAPRRIKRAFRSVFEPLSVVPSSGRSDLNLGLAETLRLREEAARKEARKLNTVEKSRMDWAGYVDKEGLKDELEVAGRAKGNFGDREEFLARVDGRREEEVRKARVATRV